MMWRIIVLVSASYVCAFVYREFGSTAASAASSAMAVVVIPLSEIERRLAELIKVAKS